MIVIGWPVFGSVSVNVPEQVSVVLCGFSRFLLTCTQKMTCPFSVPVMSSLSWVYIWFFRGTPVLVQLYFWYNGVPSVFKRLAISLP